MVAKTLTMELGDSRGNDGPSTTGRDLRMPVAANDSEQTSSASTTIEVIEAERGIIVVTNPPAVNSGIQLSQGYPRLWSIASILSRPCGIALTLFK
jgi:hypothetical protein